MKYLLLVLAITLPAPLLAAELSPAQKSVANELPFYGFEDVDVTALSPAQLSHIQLILFSKRSASQIRGNIGAILGDSLLKSVFK